MPTANLQQLRFARYPLLLGLLISGLMLARVPAMERVASSNSLDTNYGMGSPHASNGPPREVKVVKLAGTGTKLPATDPTARGNSANHSDSIAPTTPTQHEPAVRVAVKPHAAAPANPQLETVQAAFDSNKELVHDVINTFPNLGRWVASATASLAAAPGSKEPFETKAVPSPAPAELAAPEVKEAVRPQAEPEVPPQPQLLTIVRNPTISGGSIQFLVDGELYRLAAGEELRLPGNANVLLEFHRGGNFGTAQKRLSTAGTYLFEPTHEGWLLKLGE